MQPRVGTWTRLLRLIELLGFVAFLVIVAAGTWAHFTLQHRRNAPDASCYFTDALIIFIRCDDSTLASALLNWGWHSTWGIMWVAWMFPQIWHFFLINLVILILALRFLLRRRP